MASARCSPAAPVALSVLTVAQTDELRQGREAFGRQSWATAYGVFSAADRASPLGLDDLERLAVAAYLIGKDEESLDAWTRGHQDARRIGDVARAGRCGFWLAFSLLNRGDLAQGGGWVERVQRLLDESRLDCVEQGYLRYVAALRSAFEGDIGAASAAFDQAAKSADSFGNPELMTLARIGQGRCLIFLGEIADGIVLLDEAMVSVTAREVSPIAVGDAYCTMIEACRELFDLRRAREWTTALSHWCDSQPELVLYRGQCLVHRAEIMELHGAWSDALDEAQRACERLASPSGQLVVGAATYLKGELHRRRGEFAQAEEAYRHAAQHGRDPQPGLALLRLAQGHGDASLAAIRRVVDEAQDPPTRVRVLGPCVEIALAVGDLEAARTAAVELAGMAAQLTAPLVRAHSACASGAVQLAEGDAHAALVSLREGWRIWRDLEAPYEASRARVLIACACHALGDRDSANMELDAARSVFEQLGAAPDIAHVEDLSRPSPGTSTSVAGLTPREVEVLELVATGRTNRAIAAELVISEKTVATHVSSIFTKLGVSSRAAATAYAYEHDIV